MLVEEGSNTGSGAARRLFVEARRRAAVTNLQVHEGQEDPMAPPSRTDPPTGRSLV
jgi:hypothetical protein